MCPIPIWNIIFNIFISFFPSFLLPFIDFCKACYVLSLSLSASPALPSLCTYNWDSICQGLLNTKSPFKRFCERAVVTAAPAQGLILSLRIVLTAGLGPRWDSVSDSSQTVLLKFPLLKCSLSISLCTVLSTSQYQQARKFQWCQRDLCLSEAEENPWEFSEAFYLLRPEIIFYPRNIIGEEKGRWHQLLGRKISRRNDTHCETKDTLLQQTPAWVREQHLLPR